jgi:hypothetical protein
MKPFSPITQMKGSLDKQCAYDIVNGANDASDFIILRGRVRTRHPELCSFRQKKGLGGRVVKLTPVVTLDGLDGAAELSSNISKEVGQGSEGISTSEAFGRRCQDSWKWYKELGTAL